MELVFASQNQNKIDELQAILPAGISVKSLFDIGFSEEIVESAATIEGNSLIKAKCIYERYKINCLSDDTGLEVEVLNGEPGVFSSRYAGDNAKAKDNIIKLLHNLNGEDNRNARFRTVMTLIVNGNIHQFEGVINGSISEKELGNNGRE